MGPVGENKKVSVIIPAYNAGKFLAETIKCVLGQTYPDLELIIVNDGSTDNTLQVAQTFAYDSRVKIIPQANLGCSGAKNTGLAQVTGSYIQYLDADDLISADKIAEQVSVLPDDSLKIAVCKTFIFHDKPGDTEEEIDSDKLYTTTGTMDFLLNLYGLKGRRGMIQPNAFLITKKLSDTVGSWDMSISPSPDEDGEYFCRALLAATDIVYTRMGINYYRKPRNSQASLSKQQSPVHVAGALRSLQLKQKHLLAVENSDRVKKIIAEHYSEFVYMYSVTYPEYTKEAMQNMHQLGFPDTAASGGRVFKTISKFLGFRNAIRLKNSIARK